VSDDSVKAGLDRRSLLKGGLGILGAGAVGGAILAPLSAGAALGPLRGASPPVNGAPKRIHLAATDGWVSMPAGGGSRAPFWPDTLAPSPFDTYVFGFRDVTPLFGPDGEIAGSAEQAALDALKGKAQIAAPILGFDQNDEIHVSLTNLGLSVRPDLVDGHTMHWHGFNNAIPLFDGVPELSIAVPIGRKFVYEYRPREAGTYMYHCHFEDVEHVQMGMTGVLYVRPTQNGNTTHYPSGRYAYNDGDGSTGYDREFAYILTELWPEAHYRDAHIQVTDWTDFNPAFWLMNGRAYPDTVAPSSGWDPGENDLADTGRLRYQPQNGLIQANAGDRVLLRLANLGYQHHTMTLDGIPMRVVAKDAALLRGRDGTDLSYLTNSVEVGPGESRDVIVTAPAKTGAGAYDTYRLYDRAYAQLNNNGKPEPGGMLTEFRVFAAGSLSTQPLDQPNT
jgi:FtsP/CotA-like multicopper oxidase with cupredoxin domain